MTRHPFRIGAAVVIVMLAVVARATTEAQVATDASVLLADYNALQVRVDACPQGHCGDAANIRLTYAALEVRRIQLHADRAALPSSTGYQQIDAAIASIDQVAAATGGTIGGWEQE